MSTFTAQALIFAVSIISCIVVGIVAYKIYRGLTKKDGNNRR